MAYARTHSIGFCCAIKRFDTLQYRNTVSAGAARFTVYFVHCLYQFAWCESLRMSWSGSHLVPLHKWLIQHWRAHLKCRRSKRRTNKQTNNQARPTHGGRDRIDLVHSLRCFSLFQPPSQASSLIHLFHFVKARARKHTHIHTHCLWILFFTLPFIAYVKRQLFVAFEWLKLIVSHTLSQTICVYLICIKLQHGGMCCKS